MRSDDVMHADEIGERLGKGFGPSGADWVLRKVGAAGAKRARYLVLHDTDGMPLPLCSIGRPTWERSGMEAWLKRYHPLQPRLPANDAGAHPQPGEHAWSKLVGEHYAEPALAGGKP